MANASPTPSQPTSPAAASPQISLELIAESKTNPRKTLNPQADLELIESVLVHGVVQPVVVRLASMSRPVGVPQYELVVGARRFRAAQAAGLKQIPATIRDLSDEQAMEIQIVENLQREDVAPIDEGRGYTQLIAALAKKDPKRAADGQGAKRQDLVAEVARMLGKSPRYVYARMKLCELIPELQKDLEEGRIEASHGDELVRLTPKDQKDIRGYGLYLEEREQRMEDDPDIPSPSWKQKTGQRACSVRNLKVIIERDYQLTLDKAKFPIESPVLKPLACIVCPKNTAVNALLPPAAKPTCTDKECWRGKMRQHVENQAGKLAKKASSTKLVQVTLAHWSGAGSGVVGCDGWKTAKPGECKNVLAATQVEESGGVKHFQSAKHVCTNKQCKVHFGAPARTASPSGGSSSGPAKKLTLKELRKSNEEARRRFAAHTWLVEYLRRVLAKVEKLGEPEMRLLADALGPSGWVDTREMAAVLGRPKVVSTEQTVKDAKANELPRLLFALVFLRERSESFGVAFDRYAKAHGVVSGSIEAEVLAGIKVCEICECFKQRGCDLGGGKRCSWVIGNVPALKGVKTQLCSNPLCVAEASNRAAKAGAKPAAPASSPAQSSAKPAKKAAARKKGGRR